MCFFIIKDPLLEHLCDCDDWLWMVAAYVLQVIGSHRRRRWRQKVEQLIIAAMELAR